MKETVIERAKSKEEEKTSGKITKIDSGVMPTTKMRSITENHIE